jgi:Zn-dependent protease with chaperone function
MIVLREIDVALSCFAIVYCLLSALVAAAWRPARPSHVAQRCIATLLFALRVFPFVASVLVTFALVVPSLRLRPSLIDERMGLIPLSLGVFAFLLIVAGSYRVVLTQSRTTRVAAGWLEGARPLKADRDYVATWQSCGDTPPLTQFGVCHPMVLISKSAVDILSDNELRVALAHERGHIKARDNLKKLVLRFCPFPGMARLESAWAQSAELAADDAAVSNQCDAFDLAAALVKLSRLVPVDAAQVQTMHLVAGFLTLRVVRLLEWDEGSKVRRARIRAWYFLPPTVAVSLLVSIAYGSILALTHEATGWLIR